jgi:DNA-binding GntR family transcriptional regulator
MSESKRVPPPAKGRKRLRLGLHQALLDLIVTGKLNGGEKLNEVRLSQQLKVSRTPLRESLLHLEREGLVRSDLRRGFTVEPLSAKEVREIYPLLAHLECLAVRNSAGLLSPIIPELERINRAFAGARTPDRARELDTLWHETLMSQSRNSRLSAIVSNLRLAIRRYEHFYMAEAKLIPASAAQHTEIIAALRRNDMESAIPLLEQNYTFGMRVLLRKMGEE